MKPVIFMRLASALTFLHAALHTIGGVFGKPEPGVQEATVAAMKAGQFQVMGVTRTYWDFQMGLGLAVSILMLVEAIVFWELGSLVKADASRLRPILAAFLVGYLALAVNSYRYIFAPPVIIEVLIAAFLGLAIFTSRPARAS